MNRMHHKFRTGKPSLQAVSLAASEIHCHVRPFRKRTPAAAGMPTARSPRQAVLAHQKTAPCRRNPGRAGRWKRSMVRDLVAGDQPSWRTSSPNRRASISPLA